jgi:hypothetical protein
VKVSEAPPKSSQRSSGSIELSSPTLTHKDENYTSKCKRCTLVAADTATPAKRKHSPLSSGNPPWREGDSRKIQKPKITSPPKYTKPTCRSTARNESDSMWNQVLRGSEIGNWKGRSLRRSPPRTLNPFGNQPSLDDSICNFEHDDVINFPKINLEIFVL